MTEPEPRPTPYPASTVWTSRALVTAQFVLLIALVLVPRGGGWVSPIWLRVLAGVAGVAGIVIMLLGGTSLGRGLTAAPLPNGHAQLRTGGLYRWVRHPIYSGLLLMAGAIVVVSGSVTRLLVFAALVALINVKARWEERHLMRRFPGYAAYAARTPRFVPGARHAR